MIKRFAIHLCLLVSWTLVYLVPLSTSGGVTAYQRSQGGTAVDVKGIRHNATEYPNNYAPWNFADRLAAVAPNYPSEDQMDGHRGTGFFRIVIDPKTGTVTSVIILKSTGYTTLDAAATAALRRWRWKANTWKQIDMPVKFQKAPYGYGNWAPPGTIPLRQ